MNHIELLKLCHAYLRGVEINTPQGCSPINPDRLAKDINDYLNGVQATTQAQEQADRQGQRDGVCPPDQAAP